MYSKLKSCIKTKSGLTEFFTCGIGTKQGCLSSPIIFALYINDMIKYIKIKSTNGVYVNNVTGHLYAFMFADDVASIGDTVVNLQQQIKLVSDFCDETGMKLNTDKSNVMVFRNGGDIRAYERWYYKNTQLEVVPFYKYLGAYFTPKLSWSLTRETLAKQASKAVISIFKVQKNFGYFPPSEAFKLFDAIVQPILCYASELWGYEQSECTERVHYNFCRRLCGLNKSVANFFTLAECGRYPLYVTYMTRCVKYWVKLTRLPEERYPRQCYTMLRQLDEAGRNTWATKVKRLLFQHGFGYAWIANNVGDMNGFISVFKNRLKDCSLQNLKSRIDESSKAAHYRHYKTLLDPERYLSLDMSYRVKRALSNFRCSGHRLMIERGRHQNIDRDYRFCPFCLKRNVQTVEDEFHFLLVCPQFDIYREDNFLQSWKTMDPCLPTFYAIMAETATESVYAIASFIYKATKYREETIPNQ